MFLSLPRELRDDIYAYLIPDFPVRIHLRLSTWHQLEESDAMSGTEPVKLSDYQPAGNLNDYDRSVGYGSTIFTDDKEMDNEERDFKAGVRSLLLLNKQVHAEYIETLGRSDANFILYLYMENTPGQPHEFTFDLEFWRLAYRKSIRQLIVLARWHTGEGWEHGHIASQGLYESKSIGNPRLFVEADIENAFDTSRPYAMYLNAARRDFPFHGHHLHQERNPADLLDASQTSATLLNTVKAALHTLPNVQELHITLDVGGASSADLARVLETDHSKALNVTEFLDWRPTAEDGLEHIIYVNKRLFAGSFKNAPSGVEEWRQGVLEARRGEMVSREEDPGWWNVMEEYPVMVDDDVNWHDWPATHIDSLPLEDDSLSWPNYSKMNKMEGDLSVRHWKCMTDLDARWNLMKYDPHRRRADDEYVTCSRFANKSFESDLCEEFKELGEDECVCPSVPTPFAT